jgi:hypothetical protein
MFVRAVPPCISKRSKKTLPGADGTNSGSGGIRIANGEFEEIGRQNQGRFLAADRTGMKTRTDFVLMLSLVLTVVGATLTMAQQAPKGGVVPSHRPQGPCDIYRCCR